MLKEKISWLLASGGRFPGIRRQNYRRPRIIHNTKHINPTINNHEQILTMETGPSSNVELVQNTIAVEKSSIIEPLQNKTAPPTTTETSPVVQLAQNTTTTEASSMGEPLQNTTAAVETSPVVQLAQNTSNNKNINIFNGRIVDKHSNNNRNNIHSWNIITSSSCETTI